MRLATSSRLARAGVSLGTLLAATLVASNSMTAQWEVGDDTRPCMTMQSSFVGSGWHSGHTFAGVEWRIAGGAMGNIADYVSAGNRARGVTVDVTGRWEWINAGARFQCTELFYGDWIRQYHALSTRGSIVPYGRFDSVRTSAPPLGPSGGGAGGSSGPQYYLCFYYDYPNGTREYVACHAL